jgi:hypothetical protein
MTSNLWIHTECRKELGGVFKKRKVDLIPAECNGMSGFCVLSVTPDEVRRVLSTIARGVTVNATGLMVAQLKDTDIFVDVCSIHKL